MSDDINEGKSSNNIKVWIQTIHPEFLILSIVLSFLGISLAFYDGYFHLRYAMIASIGLFFSQISVNTLNDYFDFRSGIDRETESTPFSGGSDVLPEEILSPVQVLSIGVGSFLVAVVVGIYFVFVRGWMLLPLLLIAGVIIILYTPLILKTPYPEWAAGLGLGFLPIVGMYYVLTGNYTLSTMYVAVVPGILVYNLLFLNEFPDINADKVGDRKTTPIILDERKAARIYQTLTLTVYLWITVGTFLNIFPIWSLLALLTSPLAFKAIRGVNVPYDKGELLSAMGANVGVVLLTQLLLGVGYIIETFL